MVTVPNFSGGRNFQGSPVVGLKKVQGRPRPGPFNSRPQRPRQPPLFQQQQRRFPNRRPQRQPQLRQPQRPQRPLGHEHHQLTLKDTFDYEDTDIHLPSEFDDIGYNDDFENFDK